MTDHQLDVEEFAEPRGRRTPIDHFFRSLAHIHRNAVAVILSGGGTDGAVGVKDIKEQGGLLLVQHPDEAEHDSMPRAAIATGLADVILPVRQLAQKLVAYQQNGGPLRINPDTLTERDLDFVQRILSQVQACTGHDFSQYKQSTLLRRIERRMHSYNGFRCSLKNLMLKSRIVKMDFSDQNRECWTGMDKMQCGRFGSPRC